jgi:hypothetical protein
MNRGIRCKVPQAAIDAFRRANRSGVSPRRLGFEALENRDLLTTITVDTPIDVNNPNDAQTTLREAIAAAVSGDTINFSITGTINLTNTAPGHLLIDKNLTIQGPGANLLTIRAFDPDAGGNNDGDGRRVFYINGSGVLNVSISGLTLTNGDPQGDPDLVAGGAIDNRENLTLANCNITGSYAPNGGAINHFGGMLNIVDCTISSNQSDDGGGLLVGNGTVSITRGTFNNNTATNVGGGILNRGGGLVITQSTISGNGSGGAEAGLGGGVGQYDGYLTLIDSTISGNSTTGFGGGIYNAGGDLTIINSTISQNLAAGQGEGGGIFSNTGLTIDISHSTITENRVGADGEAGGIRSPGNVQLNNTIVARNVRGTNTPDDLSGEFTASYSLVGLRGGASVTNSGGSQIGTATPINPMLGGLAENGGTTRTHLPLAGSPVINTGNPAAVAGMSGVPLYDQRGTPHGRVQGGRIDIGAVEVGAPAGPALPGDYNLNTVVDAADFVIWRRTQGSTVTAFSGADGNGDTLVNGDDYGVWTANFGDTLPGGGGAITPEQNSLAESTMIPFSVVNPASHFSLPRKHDQVRISALSAVQRSPSSAAAALQNGDPLLVDAAARDQGIDLFAEEQPLCLEAVADRSDGTNDVVLDQFFIDRLRGIS